MKPGEPAAWKFVTEEGFTRFILDDPHRVASWKSSHEGEIIPLYEAQPLIDEVARLKEINNDYAKIMQASAEEIKFLRERLNRSDDGRTV